MTSEPPTHRYRYTLVIKADSHDEITSELLTQTRGGYLLDSNYETRDEFHVIGGNRTARLEHINPEMTSERYAAELDAWWQERKAERGERA